MSDDFLLTFYRELDIDFPKADGDDDYEGAGSSSHPALTLASAVSGGCGRRP